MSVGPIQVKIQEKLQSQFAPVHFETFNETHTHSLGARTGRTETHFRVILVSQQFEGQSRLERERSVYQALSLEMPLIHALSVRCFTPEEWKNQTNSDKLASPKCSSKA